MNDVDVDEVHAGDRISVLTAIGEQAVELDDQPDPDLTCPCGASITLATSFRCYYCEIWLCRPCASDHFEGAPS